MPLKQHLTHLSSFLKSKINLLALACCGLFIGFWMIVYAKRYYYFIEGWEQTYFAQILWNMLHGSLTSSIIHANFLTDHCFFISFLLAPLYWLWPDPMLLNYLKIVSFFAGAYVFFLILKKHLNPWIALGAMIAFVIAPANISLLFSIFNYEPFAIPLVFLIFKAMDDNKFKPFIICCFLLAMVKEQMPLVVMMFGVMALLFKKDEKAKWAILPIFMGLTIFIVEVFILTPYLRENFPSSADHGWIHYTQFGKTPPEILFFLFTHPARIFMQIVRPENVRWYNDLFGVWGGLALLSPHILLPALFILLKTLLSNIPEEHNPLCLLYYASTFTPFIFLAAWNTLNHVHNKWRLPIHAIALMMMLVSGFVFIPKRMALLSPPITNNTLAKERLAQEIPADASVLGDDNVPSLANRKNLDLTAMYFLGHYETSQLPFHLSADTDYLLLDIGGQWLLSAYPKICIPRMTAINFDNRWKLQESIEDIALYVKNPSGKNTARLIDRSFQPFTVKNTHAQAIDNTLGLEAIDFPPNFPHQYRILPVTMYWKCLHKTKTPYFIFFSVSSSNGKSYYSKQRPIGTNIYPSFFWRRGEYVKESYFYLLPHMPKGNFKLRFFVFSAAHKKWIAVDEKNLSIS